MSRQARLLSAHAHLTAAIRESEPWEASYKASPATFKRLVREEALLQADVNGYLLGLSGRIPQIVNWAEVQFRTVQASAVPPESDELWTVEIALLTAAIQDHLVELAVIGANAGEEIYLRPLGFSTLSESIQRAAGKYTAELVKDITSTTRRYIQQSIQSSIAQGENLEQMTARIRARVANPKRAEMIAQTESVNAYQRGIEDFAVQSGAESSTWDALLGACLLCRPLHGVTKPLGELFTLGNGAEVARPPGHPRCRCGRIINYPK
ncbi:phage minor head protein [Rathayibacter festucae]|uniref:Phage head morphogenesis domain-containing protein n=1 Tax=Rathayibacter festucae DSM 15932 TaxID=1328866 RepID=A0A3Q9UPZ9_9MICO|nr:phage minor head protein [Rathayibacter festucae]AZZ51420.1 hypothetical protein C1I64_04760 [Rathayibacter festucae DSM 15932]